MAFKKNRNRARGTGMLPVLLRETSRVFRLALARSQGKLAAGCMPPLLAQWIKPAKDGSEVAG